jgi:hypothetical protein
LFVGKKDKETSFSFWHIAIYKKRGAFVTQENVWS